jgi:gamma-glutamyltranspeptidase/glutathione hydrolase
MPRLPTASFSRIDGLRLAAIALALVGAHHINSGNGASGSAPEAASGLTRRTVAVAEQLMVSAPHPEAARIGRDILRKGGSAADAAIAIQAVLTLVEPQATGLGGGGFALHWTAGTKMLTSYDGRETAPAAARPDRFLKDGKPLPFQRVARAGISVGTPGLVRLMETLHRRHGRLPWRDVLMPAIELARTGFIVTPRLHRLLTLAGAEAFDPPARRYFFDDRGRAWPVGHRLANPELAGTLDRIAEAGADAFYRGALAEAIVAAVRTTPDLPGDLTVGDFETYGVVERPPLCIDYRRHQVCGMGPPSSGGYAVAEILKLVETQNLPVSSRAGLHHRARHLLGEAQRLAFADRDQYVGDPRDVAEPRALLSVTYLDERRRAIDPYRRMPRAEAGQLAPVRGAFLWGDDATIEAAGTSHVSIIDAAGNAIAFTSTIERAFGARIMVGGFLLNNELTDFSWRPRDTTGRPAANAVGPGKRPRSSMAPTMVFGPDGSLAHVLGSTGGSAIISYVSQALVALIDGELDPQAAAALPQMVSRTGPVELEDDGRAAWAALRLVRYGHSFKIGAQTSGTHIVSRRNGRLEGGADPRKEGVALGD